MDLDPVSLSDCGGGGPSRTTIPTIASNKKDEVKNLFVSHLDFDEPSKEKIKKQTFVCLNSNMFKVKLNYPEKKTPLQIANENADALTIAQKVLSSVN